MLHRGLILAGLLACCALATVSLGAGGSLAAAREQIMAVPEQKIGREAARPPLDAAAPAKFETATFALG